MTTSDINLTDDEKRCLKMWMRQAIVKLEQQEAIGALLADNKVEPPVRTAHTSVAGRRTKRVSTRAHELV